MRVKRQLAVVVATATLIGTSAFAESRPSNETRGRSGGNIQSRERSAPRVEGSGGSRRGDASSSSAPRSSEARARSSEERSRSSEGRIQRRSEAGASGSRVEVEAQRSGGTRDGRTWAGRAADRTPERSGSWRGDRSDRNRRDGNWRSDNNRGGRGSSYGNRRGHHYGNRGHHYGNRTPYYHHGRISRVHRHGSGYRVWLIGAPYPYFIPAAYYHSSRFGIGLSIRLGGYYNPLGYYDYYDSRYTTTRGYSDGVIRGVVESVDRRRDTFVIRNEATGSFVTVDSRDRRRDDVRAGDYVELSGEWTRSGVFQAWDVDFLDYDDRGR